MVWTIILSALMIGADRLFKILAAQYLQPVGAAPLIPGVIGLQYLQNQGAAFGIFRGHQLPLIIITGLGLLVIAYILFVRRPKDKTERVAFLFLFTGGVGNLIDRIAQGYVVDYLEFQFINFPIFNLADIFVCVGAGLLILALVLSELRDRKKKRAVAEGAPAQTPQDDADDANS